MKEINTKYTLLEKTKHFFSFLWLIIKLIWQTLRNKWVWLAVGVITYTYVVAWFNNNYTIDCKFKFGIYPRSTPIKKVSVVPTVKAQEPKPTDRPKTEKEIVLASKNGKVLWNVYMLESTRGKADYCRIKGNGYAGFGVLDNNRKVVCYPTFEKAVERADYWLGLLKPEVNLINALCSYNLGGLPNGLKHMNCNYYQNYLQVANME